MIKHPLVVKESRLFFRILFHHQKGENLWISGIQIQYPAYALLHTNSSS